MLCPSSQADGSKGMGVKIAVWVSKNSGLLQSGNFGCLSGVKEGENGDFKYKSADSPGHWTGIFTDKGSETEICFTECVEVKKWLALCEIISEKAAGTVCGRYKKSSRRNIGSYESKRNQGK